MQTNFVTATMVRIVLAMILISASFSCEKEDDDKECGAAPLDFNVVLRGTGTRLGHIQFSQDPDAAQIITLDTCVLNLAPKFLNIFS